MNHRAAMPLGGAFVGGPYPQNRARAAAIESRRLVGALGRAIRGAVWAREVAIAVTAYLVYFRVRGATEGDVHVAREHAVMIQQVEQSLHLFIEPTLQQWVLGLRWAVDLSNWVYVFGHWPVIAVVFIWLYRTRPRQYRELRTAFLISGAIGLVIFALFPVAPPRLAEMGLVDTVSERSSMYRILQPPQLTNQYAAVPSLHVGWNLLIGIALVSASSRRLVRWLGVLSPVVMVGAVLLTANHYVVDAAAGATLAMLGLGTARALTARRWALPRRATVTADQGLCTGAATVPIGAAQSIVSPTFVWPALPAPDSWHYSPIHGLLVRCSPTDPRCSPARGTLVWPARADRELDGVPG